MPTNLWGVDLTAFNKAYEIFEDFRKNLATDQEKAGAVQAFEFCYELAWKTLKRLLQKKGIEVSSPRDCFREAALNQMISDPKVWFGFLEKRNLTVHTYNHTTLEQVVQEFDAFSKALQEIFTYIKIEHATESRFS